MDELGRWETGSARCGRKAHAPVILLPCPSPPPAGWLPGYISPNWADWTVLPALNVANDALMTGDLETLARASIDALALNHTCAWLRQAGSSRVQLQGQQQQQGAAAAAGRSSSR